MFPSSFFDCSLPSIDHIYKVTVFVPKSLVWSQQSTSPQWSDSFQGFDIPHQLKNELTSLKSHSYVRSDDSTGSLFNFIVAGSSLNSPPGFLSKMHRFLYFSGAEEHKMQHTFP